MLNVSRLGGKRAVLNAGEILFIPAYYLHMVYSRPFGLPPRGNYEEVCMPKRCMNVLRVCYDKTSTLLFAFQSSDKKVQDVDDKILSSVSLSIRSLEQDIMATVEKIQVPIAIEWSPKERLCFVAQYITSITHEMAKVEPTVQHAISLIESRFQKRISRNSVLEEVKNEDALCLGKAPGADGDLHIQIRESGHQAAKKFLMVRNGGARGILFANYMEAMVAWALGDDCPTLDGDVPVFLLYVLSMCKKI